MAGRAAAVWFGQKAGVALAAAALVVIIAVPSPTTSTDAEPIPLLDTAQQPAVAAPADAAVPFARTPVGTSAGPNGRLTPVLGTGSARGVAGVEEQRVLGAPLSAMVPSSPYGYRVSPLSGLPGEFHRGQDFAAQCGTEVRSAAGGLVTLAGWHAGGGGNRVVVDHGNGLQTTYNHLAAFSVRVGQEVERGAVVALSGTTGASTGCHLHFEVMVNGEVVDPNGWL